MARCRSALGVIALLVQSGLTRGARPFESADPRRQSVALAAPRFDLGRLDQLIVEQAIESLQLTVERGKRGLILLRAGHRPQTPDLGTHHVVVLAAGLGEQLRLQQLVLGLGSLQIEIERTRVQVPHDVSCLDGLTEPSR